MKVDTIPNDKIIKSTFILRRKFGSKANIKGMLPACGIQIATPAVSGTSTIPQGERPIPTFGFAESNECQSAQVASEFPMTIQVPMDLEPTFSRAITEGIGFPLPSITYLHPAKNQDKVSLTIDLISIKKWEGRAFP